MITSDILMKLDSILELECPDLVLVHGDTDSFLRIILNGVVGVN